MKTRYILYGICVSISTAAIGSSWYLASHPLNEGDVQIRFLDLVRSNADPDVVIADFVFTDVHGEELTLRDLLTTRNLVLVILRGNTGSVCPYCSTQTSRLIANYNEFVDRNAELVVVYPIERSADQPAFEAFMRGTRRRLEDPSARILFPLVLDIGLPTIDQLGIRAFLSKPATYILDKRGNVRFAYVGSRLADHPSVQAMLEVCDSLNR